MAMELRNQGSVNSGWPEDPKDITARAFGMTRAIL